MRLLVCVVFLSFLSACDSNFPQEFLNPVELINWVEEEKNGLKKERKFKDYSFCLQLQPVSYQAVQKIRKREIVKKELKSQIDLIGEDLIKFSFRISPDGIDRSLLNFPADNQQEYLKLIAYISSEMQYDFQLLQGVKDVDCIMYQFVRNYNLSPHIDILLAFPANQIDQEQDFTLQYNDRLLNIGPIKFPFYASDIKELPRLQTI